MYVIISLTVLSSVESAVAGRDCVVCEGEWVRWISGIRNRIGNGIGCWIPGSKEVVGVKMRVMFPLNLSNTERPGRQ